MTEQNETKQKIEKKIKKIVEEIILLNQDEFTQKFSPEEMKDVLKHKTQIATLAVEDNLLKNIIKDEVEDCIGMYLIKKGSK